MSGEVTETSPAKEKRSPWPRYDAAVLGFRNYWYPALASRRVRRKPVSLKVLGERLVFIRYQSRCYALEDRCAHRGVPLSVGRCEFPGTKTISCRYHGWTYDVTNGLCIGAMTDGPDSPLVGKARVRSYPVEERKGLIWVYIGDGEPPPLERDVPPEFLEERAVIGMRVNLRRGNWRLAAENGLDPAHAAYLHRNAWLAFFRRFSAYKSRLVTEVQEDWVGYTQSAPVMECDYPGLGHWPRDARWWQKPKYVTKTQLRLPGILRVNPFPAPGIVQFEWYVPVDERHHRYFQCAVRWGTGWRALWFSAAYWLWWRWLAHFQFTGQDAWIVGLMAPFYEEEDGWHRERLFRPDVALTNWRKHCHENAREVQKIFSSRQFANGDGYSKDQLPIEQAWEKNNEVS